MMVDCSTTNRRPFRASLLVSGALHALAVFFLWFLSGRGGERTAAPDCFVDNRARVPGSDVQLVLLDLPKQRRTKPSPAPDGTRLDKVVVPQPTRTATDSSAAPTPPIVQWRLPAAESAGPAAALSVGSGASNAAARPTCGTSFFQIPAKGKSVVYVIDRSASMGVGGLLARAKQELRRSLVNLPPDARFQIIPYNRFAEPLRLNGRTELAPATEANKLLAAHLLDTVEAEGSTDHWPALRRALALHADVIYFLTGADDLKAEQVRAVQQLNRGRSVIHTIELDVRNRDRHDLPLHRLAETSGGTYRAVNVRVER